MTPRAARPPLLAVALLLAARAPAAAPRVSDDAFRAIARFYDAAEGRRALDYLADSAHRLSHMSHATSTGWLMSAGTAVT